MEKHITSDESDDKDSKPEDHFSIYNVPNINTASIKRLKLYMKSRNLDDNLIAIFIQKVKLK